jgi:alpha-1,2-mannosyltransferase
VRAKERGIKGCFWGIDNLPIAVEGERGLALPIRDASRSADAPPAFFRDASWITQSRLSIYPKLFLIAYIAIAVLQLAMVRGVMYPNGEPIGSDFVNVWAASASALKGHPAAIYDIRLHHAAEQAAVGNRKVGLYGWHYPPTFLLIALPLALLPYVVAALVWESATLLAFVSAIRRIIPSRIAPSREALWLLLAFPPVMINFVNGQNGFLTAALFGYALTLLESRPVVAGIFFGLLTYKPQFGLLIPLALIASRRRRTFISASATAGAFALTSLILFGSATWRAFFASVSLTRGAVLENGGLAFFKLESAFGAIRMWGGSTSAAYAAQMITAFSAAAVVIWLWRKGGEASFALQAAALCTGSLLVTPYVIDYDLVLLALPIAWMAIEGCERGFLPFEKFALAVVSIYPFVSRTVAASTLLPLGPIVNSMFLALIVRRALHAERQGK